VKSGAPPRSPVRENGPSSWFLSIPEPSKPALGVAFGEMPSNSRNTFAQIGVSLSMAKMWKLPGTTHAEVFAGSNRSAPLLLTFGMLGVATGFILLVATMHWYDTRNFVLVNMPVSLAPGHIKTGGFATNLKGTYGITIRVNEFRDLDCPEYAVLKTRWVVTRDGRVSAHRERGEYPWLESNTPIQGTDLYSFDAEPGTYNLDVEVLSDGRCLDVRKPRLRVSLSGEDRAVYDDLSAELQLLSLLSIGIGLALLLADRAAKLRKRPGTLSLSPSFPDLKSAWGITGLRSKHLLTGRARTVNPRLNLPTVALASSLTCFTCFVPICIVVFGGHLRSMGLLVSIPKKDIPPASILSGPSAPLITIDGKDHIYLNYKQTSWEELPTTLDQALRGLPVRVVYFDGDSRIPFMEAARAIDIIEGLNAIPLLMTPGSKAENQKSLDSTAALSRRII
jgi:biopolymer transport protein ExbD